MLRGIQRPEYGAHEGVRIGGERQRSWQAASRRLRDRLDRLGLAQAVDLQRSGDAVRARLRPELAGDWMPGHDTTGLAVRLDAALGGHPDALERETLVSLLGAPAVFEFPDVDEFDAALRVREDTAREGARTVLRFDCEEQRPQDCWDHDPEQGFRLRPGCDLVEALRRATQPPEPGSAYGFGCYRATEYVMLLAIARELGRSNPALLDRLQRRFTRRPIQSREFHDALLREHGTMEAPLPARWFVPGDRVWFRNPDSHSADAAGFEGSWVIYLGAGRFGNFWQTDRPFTLVDKCVEIHHWRHAAYTDAQGQLRIDEDEVARRVALTMADPAALAAVLETMQRWRDPRGVYAQGGCLDRTRECARWLCPATCDVSLAEH